MAVEGYRVATTATGADWSTQTNIFVRDDSDATTVAATQGFLEVEGWGFTIPDNAIIRGFEIEIEGSSATTRSIDVFLTKDGSATVGTLINQALTTTDAPPHVLGGATNLFGTTWDVAEVNAATFGVFIRDDTASASDIQLDSCNIRVYYDFGIRGEWDTDYDDQEMVHIDSYIDYDGGTGGTAPADDDVLYSETTAAAVGKVVKIAAWNTTVLGTLAMSEQHDADFVNNDALEVCSYVTFDAEASGGITEADIGTTFTASVGSTRTGTIRHVKSDGTTGTVWWDVTGEAGTAIIDNSVITVDGTARTVTADAGETVNAWAGAVNGAQIETTQGTLLYDGETVPFESSSGSGRIRSSDFQHNMCIYGGTSGHTAMIVRDFEDPNATDTGTLFLIDTTGVFANNDALTALEEVDYISEGAAGFAIGDTVTGLSSSVTGVVRRLIDNGTSGTLYLSAVSGTYTQGEALQVSAVTQGTHAAQRARVGAAVADQTLVTTNVQWHSSHLFTDLMDLFDELIQMDDQTPMDAQVLDQQYTARNRWLVPFYSTRRLAVGALNELDTQGGTDSDSVFTNYFHLGSLFSQQNLYVQQGATVLEQFWDAGSPTDVLLRNKNKNLNVSGGSVTWYVRAFGELYDFFSLSPVGLRNPVPLNTGDDLNNNTSYATVQTTAVYHDIEMAWASHTLQFNTGTGTTLEVGDVIHNETTINNAVMVARVPDSLTSGSDLHVAANGQDITGWLSADVLNLLDYVDFDTQVSQFSIGQVVESAGAGPTAVTIRWIQQFGASRGRIWFSDQAGSNWGAAESIRPDGGGATIATTSAAQVVANDWAGQMTGTLETIDNTVLKDIGVGGDQPYNVVFNLNGASVQEWYEMSKFITEERAGSATDPGSLLFPNDTVIQGRLYQTADSAYGAGDLIKPALLGSFAGGTFFGARGVFIENMLAADAQAYQLIDAAGTTRNPPNVQAVTVSGLVIGDTVAVYRRSFTDDVSLTFNDDDGSTNSEITRGAGSFIRDGFVVGESVTVDSGTNDGTFVVKSVAALTLQLEGVVLVDEGPVSADLRGSSINKETLQGAASGNNSGDPDFVVQETIPSDYPSSGQINIVNTNGSEIYEDRLAYSSFTASTFTLSGTLPRTYDGDARVYVPLIEKVATATSESQTIIYSADFPIKGVVRLKGIVPFEQNVEFSSTGASIQAIRQTDGIVE